MSRFTRDGWITVSLALALGLVALVARNNLLVLIVASLLGLLTLQALAGAWNVRRLTARRVLPADLFAEVPARGHLAVGNDRRILASFDLRLTDPSTGARATLDRVEAGATVAAPVSWRFERRGRHRLGPLLVSSTYPFGLLEHTATVPRADEVVVYPRIRPASSQPALGEEVGDRDTSRGRGQGSEHHGLRPYRAGDRTTAIHWPTSARSAEVMVVQRVGESEPLVLVQIRGPIDSGWEERVGRGAGRIVEAAAMGYRIGMELPAVPGVERTRFDPDAGSRWRRALLEALALLPAGPR